MSGPIRSLLTLVALTASLTGFYLTRWQPLWAQQEATRRALAERIEKKDQIQKALAELPVLTERLEQLRSQVSQTMQSMLEGEAPGMMVANVISELESALARAGLRLVSLTPGPLVATEDQLGARTFQLQLTGQFDDLMTFLDTSAELGLRRPLTIDRLELSPLTGGDRSSSPNLSIKMPVTTYGRQPI